MKIKNILYAMFCAVCFSVVSCDTVGENDRLIYVKPAEVKRCVLLEDFTGQRCVNCPEAVKEIKKLQEQYGEDNVIAVGIHGGPLAVNSNGKVTGLRTATGDEYYAAAGSPSLPAGRVGRVGGTYTSDQWQLLVYNQIQLPSVVAIEAACSYEVASHELTVDVSALSAEKVDGKLQIWLVEDGIVATQLKYDDEDPSKSVYDAGYIHNHVFRMAVNGTWGEEFNLAEGEARSVSRTATIDSAWKPENMSVVAFIYNDNGVQQVTKTKLINNEPEQPAE